MSDVNPLIQRAIQLYADKGKQQGLAEACDVSQGMVSGWLHNRYEITWEMAKRIEKATGGSITRYDLRPDIFGDKPTADAA
ncbi:transcriptional regulator [Marinobacterium stanieri]|uniref:transcriptional regulator n=1 Tax=Marinobacterium stanieri TaxID=49186 RepID=UPI000255A5E5|nr:YdaS family helix-turn-helix protein [Marinobacterium stanieri]